jgi:hypothetical protein
MEPRTFNLRTRLKEARKNIVPAISAVDLGRRLIPANLPGFKPAQVSMMELGYRYATWSEVEALARVLNVDPYWLANKPRPAASVPRATDFWQEEVKPAVRSLPVPVEARPVVAAPIKTPAPMAPPAPPDLAPADIPVLVPGAEAEYRRQMVDELARTLVKLGDTRLKPFEWRSWREHEKRLRAAADWLVG